MTIIILMATCNGGAYVAEQIRSIQAQTYEGWRLLVRDDVSTDDTRSLIERIARTDARIELLPPDDGGRVGARRNFALLLAEALRRKAAYVALADQDDHWLPDKLRLQAEAMTRLEAQQGPVVPCLAHSDLSVVDAEMRPIRSSFVDYQGIHLPTNPPALTCLLQNHIVGCTILVNRALLAVAVPVPEGIHMHDWWLNVCVRFSGATDFIAAPLVQYRQHGRNRIGARGIQGLLGGPRRWIGWLRKMSCLYRQAFFQARLLDERLRARPDLHVATSGLDPARLALDELVAAETASRLNRTAFLIRHRVKAQHPALTLLLYAQSLLVRVSGFESTRAFTEGCRE